MLVSWSYPPNQSYSDGRHRKTSVYTAHYGYPYGPDGSNVGSEKFIRIRVGVGAKPKDWDLADFVLGHFSDSDRKLVDEGINDAAEAVEMILSEGVDAAMNKYNRKKPKN